MARIARLLATASALALVTSSPADAVYVAHLNGTGSYSPGLPGCASVSFSGSAAFAGDPTGTYSFGISGDACGSLLAENGDGLFFGDFGGQVVWSRTATLLTMSSQNLTINGRPIGVFTAACDWTPTSIEPISSYALACAAAPVMIACDPCIPARLEPAAA